MVQFNLAGYQCMWVGEILGGTVPGNGLVQRLANQGIREKSDIQERLDLCPQLCLLSRYRFENSTVVSRIVSRNHMENNRS